MSFCQLVNSIKAPVLQIEGCSASGRLVDPGYGNNAVLEQAAQQEMQVVMPENYTT